MWRARWEARLLTRPRYRFRAQVGRWLAALLCVGAGACSVYDESLLASHAGDDGQPEAPAPGMDVSTPPAPAPDPDAPRIEEPTTSSLTGGEQTAPDPDRPPAPAPSACRAAPVDDYCAALSSLPIAAAIDGELDCDLRLQPIETGEQASVPIDHVASVAAAVRPDGLYVFVEVRGAAPVPASEGEPSYCGDAVELFVDADGRFDGAGHYDGPGTMQFIVAAPADEGAPGPVRAERYAGGTSQGLWVSDQLAVHRDATGYTVEALIRAADLGLWTWAPAGQLGFDIAIDVSVPQAGPGATIDAGSEVEMEVDGGSASTSDPECSGRRVQYALRVGPPAGDCGGEPWCDARAFCAPELVVAGAATP